MFKEITILTFNQNYLSLQQITGDTSASMLVFFKRWLNHGKNILAADLGRYYTRKEVTFDLTISQQYYQMPEDCVRMTGVVATVNSIAYPLEEVQSEQDWRYLNATTTSTATIPTHFFVRGADEFGLYPIPAATVSLGGSLYYEARERDFTQDDYTTGTVTMTAGSAAVAGAGTTFTANMVGRSLNVTDGSADGMWYKIATYVGAGSITLDNNYGGSSGGGKSFLIGEVSQLPEDTHEYPLDYAMWQYSKSRRDPGAAKEYKAIWDDDLATARKRYARKTSSRVIHGKTPIILATGLNQLPSNIS